MVHLKNASVLSVCARDAWGVFWTWILNWHLPMRIAEKKVYFGMMQSLPRAFYFSFYFSFFSFSAHLTHVICQTVLIFIV